MRVKDRYVVLKDTTLADYCPERGDIVHILAVGKNRVFVRCKCYDKSELVEVFEDMVNKCDLKDDTQYKKLKKGERRPKIGKYYDDPDSWDEPSYPANVMSGATNWTRENAEDIITQMYKD